MFSQENITSRSKYEGTGLGLAISEKMAESLGGTIEIKSQKGIGTTVRVTLPFKIGNPEKLAKAESHEEISLEGKRALVAEDNELNMEIVLFILDN